MYVCYMSQDSALWACLAGMAASARELNTAQAAYAAINEVLSMHHNDIGFILL